MELDKREFKEIRVMIEELLKKFKILNTKMNLLYRADQINNRDLIYKINLELIVENLQSYLIVILREIFRVLGAEL